MTLDILFFVALILFVAGFVHSAIGFGMGIVALSLLPLVIDPKVAHIMLALCSIPMLLMASWEYRKGIDWESIWPALVGASISIPLGLYLFKVMSLDFLVRSTGVAILAMVLLSLKNKRMNNPARQFDDSVDLGETTRVDHQVRWSSFIAGSISGFLGGAVSIGGPPLATFGLSQGWKPERFKAFLTQCLLVMSTYKVLGLFTTSMVTQESLIHFVWATPFAIGGIHSGAKVSGKLNADKFQIMVAIVLIGISLMLIYRGQPGS